MNDFTEKGQPREESRYMWGAGAARTPHIPSLLLDCCFFSALMNSSGVKSSLVFTSIPTLGERTTRLLGCLNGVQAGSWSLSQRLVGKDRKWDYILEQCIRGCHRKHHHPVFALARAAHRRFLLQVGSQVPNASERRTATRGRDRESTDFSTLYDRLGNRIGNAAENAGDVVVWGWEEVPRLETIRRVMMEVHIGRRSR